MSEPQTRNDTLMFFCTSIFLIVFPLSHQASLLIFFVSLSSESLFIGLGVFRATLAAKRLLSAQKKGDGSTDNYPSLMQDPWYSLVPAPSHLANSCWTIVYYAYILLVLVIDCHTRHLCCCWCDLPIHSDCLTIFCCLCLYVILSPW